jgi:hypothetical protein
MPMKHRKPLTKEKFLPDLAMCTEIEELRSTVFMP